MTAMSLTRLGPVWTLTFMAAMAAGACGDPEEESPEAIEAVATADIDESKDVGIGDETAGTSGCKTDDECGELRCFDGTCVACAEDTDCVTGTVCVTGACVAGCRDQGAVVADCNDQDLCTVDRCDNYLCVFDAAKDGADCSLGLDDPCQTGQCLEGVCIDKTAPNGDPCVLPDADYNVACAQVECQSGACKLVQFFSGVGCDAGQDTTCGDGVCNDAGTCDVVAKNVGESCGLDEDGGCRPALCTGKGTCEYGVAPDGAACDTLDPLATYADCYALTCDGGRCGVIGTGPCTPDDPCQAGGVCGDSGVPGDFPIATCEPTDVLDAGTACEGTKMCCQGTGKAVSCQPTITCCGAEPSLCE